MKGIIKLNILFLALFVLGIGFNVLLSMQKYETALANFLEGQMTANLGTLDMVIQTNTNSGLPLKQIQNIQQVIERIVKGGSMIQSIDVFDSQSQVLFTTHISRPNTLLDQTEVNSVLFSQNVSFRKKQGDLYFYYKRLRGVHGKIFGGYRVVYSDYYKPVKQQTLNNVIFRLLPILGVILMISIVLFSILFTKALSVFGYWGQLLVGGRAAFDDKKHQRLHHLLGDEAAHLTNQVDSGDGSGN